MATPRHQCDCTTMIRVNCLLVLATGFQVITSQGFPDGPPPGGPPPGFPNNKCAGPPPGVKNPQSCCQVKPIFSEKNLSECGFEKIEDENRLRQGPPGPPNCSKQECLLQKIDAIKDDKTVDHKAVKEYMNEWVKSNPDFEAAVATAQAVCMGEDGPPGPPQICEANKLMYCVITVMFSECPSTAWQDTDDCKRLKQHISECKGSFPPS